MSHLEFEWDEAKNLANIRNHGISFIEAQSVFADEYALLIADPHHSEDEDRFLLLGLSGKLRVLVVCHCFEVNERLIRIISCRKANRKETTRYRR